VAGRSDCVCSLSWGRPPGLPKLRQTGPRAACTVKLWQAGRPAPRQRTTPTAGPSLTRGIIVRPVLAVVAALFSAPLVSPADEPAPKLPTLFIVGDSTVRTGTKGQQGWGDPVIALFDKTKIKVENHAIGGRSSRTFQTEGRWDKILEAARPG